MASQNDSLTSRQMTASEEAAYSQRGKALVNQLSIFLKTARVHFPDNDTFKTQLEQCYAIVRSCLDEFNEASIQVHTGYFFFCGVRVRYDADGLSAPDHLRELFSAVGISGFLTTSEVTKSELEQAVLLLNEAERQTQMSFEEIQRRFDLAGVATIELLPLTDEDQLDKDKEREKRQFARKTFFYAMTNLKMVANTMTANRPVDLARTKRVVHSLVDQISADDSYLLELTALKTHDQYTFLHSTNVCIYAICVGAKLDLSKTELSTLGFSALFHDIGKTRLPLQVLNKPTKFDDSDWEMMRMHPTYGVLTLAKTLPFEERSCRAMIVTSQHHYNLNGSGYPVLKRQRVPNLYSKIVTICDVFDAMTSGRVYRKIPASPEQVLRSMVLQAEFKFDPHLLKVFLNTVSLYPPGTLLLLDQDELALVVGKNNTDLLRPKVKVIGDTRKFYERGIDLNLAERDPRTGDFRRSIVRVVEPQEVRVNVARYLLEEA